MPRSDAAKGETQFAYYPVRRLEAEVLIDALNQITGTREEYSSGIPEPFTFIPEEQRSITLADGSISSPFLELFGRPPRDSGLESERNNRSTAAQSLHLLNSTHVYWKITHSRGLHGLALSGKSLREIADELYLTILSRPPTEDELKTMEAYAKTGVAKQGEIPVDLAWALHQLRRVFVSALMGPRRRLDDAASENMNTEHDVDASQEHHAPVAGARSRGAKPCGGASAARPECCWRAGSGQARRRQRRRRGPRR